MSAETSSPTAPAAVYVSAWRSCWQIFVRDLRSYFRTPSGYLIWAISLLIDGLLFNSVAIGEGRRLSTDVLQIYLFNAAFVVEAAAVVLSMRLLAQERASGAQLLLFTSPLGEAPLVLGRFFAAFTLLAMVSLSSLYLPALIFVHGKVSLGHIGAGYLGMLLVAASTLAIGMWVSALASRPFVAVLATAALVGSLELCYFVGRITEGSAASFVSNLAPVWEHYQSFRRGLLDLGDLAFFLTLTYLGLLAAMRVLAGARRRGSSSALSRPSLASLGLAGLGLLCLVIGERLVGEGWGRTLADGLGALALLAAPALRLRDASLAGAGARGARRFLLGSYLALYASPLVYASTTSGMRAWAPGLLGESGLLGTQSAQTALGLLWPSLFLLACASIFSLEVSLSTLRIVDESGRSRVLRALTSGLSLAFAVVFVVSVDYAASEDASQWDLSYRKTTEPSASTLRMAAAVNEDTRIVLLYPSVNPVLSRIEPYFRRVANSSPHLNLVVVDHALAPELVRRHHIRGNGYVAIVRGEGEGAQAENFEVGLELDAARSRLRTLDGQFQQTFSRLLHQRRELSFTTGHHEHTAAGQEGDDEGMRAGELVAALRRSNLSVTQLGMAQGLARDVPADTPAVVVFGPRSPFLPEEADALLRYVHAGGRLIVLVDPDTDTGLAPLLAGLGLELAPGVACSETEHLSRSHTPADRALTYTNLYSAHPTVTLANRHASELATVFVGAGSLQQLATPPEGVSVTFPMRFGPNVWLDLDANFERGEGETATEAHPMAAVTVANPDGEEGRVVVVADGDFATDSVIRNPGNGSVLSDILQWMLGEEQVIADTSSEEDVPIEHTSREDAVWFYATSFGLPLPILALGIFVAARRRRRPKRKVVPPATGAGS